MKVVGIYEVTGAQVFRDHRPGTVFAALLNPRHESRALGRGSISLIERRVMDLPGGKYRLPDGWSQPNEKEES